MGKSQKPSAGFIFAQKTRKAKRLRRNFLSSTSIPVLRYLGDEDCSVFERAIWLCVSSVGLFVAAYLFALMFDEYLSEPYVTAIEKTNEKLSAFPFPSVTICNQNKISQRKFQRWRHHPGNEKFLALNQEQILLAMEVLGKVDSAHGRLQEIENIQQVLILTNISTTELIDATLQVMVACEDMLLDCKWLGTVRNCSQVFNSRPTDDGHCCSFNAIEKGWKLGSEELTSNTIERLDQPGMLVGLSVVLDAQLDDGAVASGHFQGFKVLLHHHSDYPDVGERGYAVPPGYQVSSGVIPIYSYNSPQADALPLHERECYGDADGKVLQFYNNYTVTRCIMECLTKIYLDRCGCRPYYLPANSKDPYCNLESYLCLQAALDAFRDRSPFATCQQYTCYPICNDFWYMNELSFSPFSTQVFAQMNGRIAQSKQHLNESGLEDYLRSNVAILNVFYKELTGYVYNVDVRYSVGDLIAAVGGLLAIGLNMSVISAIEVLYFMFATWFLLLPLPATERHQQASR